MNNKEKDAGNVRGKVGVEEFEVMIDSDIVEAYRDVYGENWREAMTLELTKAADRLPKKGG